MRTCQHTDACTRHEPGHHDVERCHVPGTIGCALTELEIHLVVLFRPLVNGLARLVDQIAKRLPR
jgi:hypothetical protein